MAHTQGPWKVIPNYSSALAGVQTQDGIIICDVLTSPGDDNACLIAAAPDLLDAVLSLMKAYGAQTDSRNGNSGECWDKARAAVAKAVQVPAH